MKRTVKETHSAALGRALADSQENGDLFVTSALARVEVARALRTRLDTASPHDLGLASSDAFEGVAIAPVAESVIEHARVLGPPILRSLDAIHLATAVSVAADELWTYDERLACAAEELGIPTRSPA